MKPTTAITLLAAWIWAFQGCDNKPVIAKKISQDKKQNIQVPVKKASVTLLPCTEQRIK